MPYDLFGVPLQQNSNLRLLCPPIQIRICSANLNSKYLVHRSKRIFLFLQKFSRIIHILFFNI